MPATYCDRHPSARAANVYTLGTAFLFFCGHCSHQHELTLASQGWDVDAVTQPCGPSDKVAVP